MFIFCFFTLFFAGHFVFWKAICLEFGCRTKTKSKIKAKVKVEVEVKATTKC